MTRIGALRRSRRGQWVAAVVVASFWVVALGAGYSVWNEFSTYPERPGLGDARSIEVDIPAGASFPQVLDLLVESGVVAEADRLRFRVFVLHKGSARKTTAGLHRFRGDMTAAEIVAELARPQKAKERTVTIPEGKHMLEVAELLEKAGLGSAEQLVAAMRDRALLDALGIEGDSAEGYLYPDTYKFGIATSPHKLITRMVRRHQEIFGELKRKHRRSVDSLRTMFSWGDREIVTLASIVEKETGVAHERPLIAGVFLNRLRFRSFQPKLLQTDPTIIYGCTVPVTKSDACRQFHGRIRTIHLRDRDNLYSTYTHEGLPPGPISNPGRAALEAVLAPKDSRYLYFVSRNDGTHQFSKSVAEHEQWVELYMRQGKVGPLKP